MSTEQLQGFYRWARGGSAIDNPRDCDETLRDGNCVLDKDHRGRHTTVGFCCDVCGKMRRGRPHIRGYQLLSDGSKEHVADVCFMCAVVDVDR